MYRLKTCVSSGPVRTLASLFLALAAIIPLAAQPADFTTIDYPGAVHTGVRKINDSGDIVGYFIDSSNASHGFLLSGGRFTEIKYPGAANLQVNGINNRGDMVGMYNTGSGARGFLLRQGEFTTLECPGSDSFQANAINSNGEVAGWVNVAGIPAKGAVWNRGVCTLGEYAPGNPRRTMTMYWGINDEGAAVGHFRTNGGDSHGVLYRNGTFTRHTPGGGGWANHQGINNAGDIVGGLTDAYGQNRAYLLHNGRYTVYDFPGAASTGADGINSSGQVIGNYTISGITHGYLTRVHLAGPAPPVLTVDDDGGDCPGAISTIQEAVRRAVPGATIRVCPGIYYGTVEIKGPEKDGVKLIAAGAQDEVVLQGDYSELSGFHLMNVTGVLVRGFTVRDFGAAATTATVFGSGNLIHLENADYNGIEYNRLINGDMMGVMIDNSIGNVIEHNTAFVTNSGLTNCGIHMQGKRSAANSIRNNMTYGNKMAGIMIRDAGPDNWVLNNTVLDNGRYGIDVQNTETIWIEGNRVSNGRGPWGTAPFARDVMGVGLGINLLNVNKATLRDNRARGNTGVDLNWDGKGTNTFNANACENSEPAGVCAR